MLYEVALGLVALFCLLYLYITKHHDHWRRKGVVQIPTRFPFGIMHDRLFSGLSVGAVYQQWYEKYKGLRYVGGFLVRDPSLIVLDLDLCKSILTKDFNHFVSRNFLPITHEYISKHLFAMEGQEWREMRTKLTPTFTSGKMKGMLPLMEKCAQQLQEHVDDVILEIGEFDVKALIARFTTDIIATCAFGLEVNSIKNPDDEFFKTGQLLFKPRFRQTIVFFMNRYFPTMTRLLKINFYNPRVSKVLTRVMKDSTESRVKNSISRNDFVDLLLKVKENRQLEDEDKDKSEAYSTSLREKIFNYEPRPKQKGLTLEEIVAQAFVFFAAGFETAASTTSFCLFELAKTPNVQERLRQEIDDVMAKHDGKIGYQDLQSMTYMEQVVNETLRRYASLPILPRGCTERYQVPGTDLVIEKGVQVIIPIYAIHHDPDIYQDPYCFDPERFAEDGVRSRHPYAFLPFGEGPRMCIGIRFGKLQVKIGLAAILSRYVLSPAPSTPSQLEISSRLPFTTATHPFRLNISKRPSL